MKLEGQVCDLEYSKKLLTLGVKQEGLFYWNICPDCEKGYPDGSVKWELSYGELHGKNIVAFTSSELLYMLPSRITLKENIPFNSFTLRINKAIIANEDNNLVFQFLINYRCDSTECSGENAWLERTLFPHNIYDENPANAFAKALIYIIENGMIKL